MAIYNPGSGSSPANMWNTYVDAGNSVYGPISERRVRDLDSVIHWLEPDQTPWYTFLTSLPARTTVNPKFEWFEGDALARSDTVSSGDTWASNEATLTMSDGDLFHTYQIVQMQYTDVTAFNVIAIVTGVSGNNVTFKGITGHATSTVANDTVVEIIGTAHPEGSGRGEAHMQAMVPKSNFTQIFKSEVAMSGTAVQAAWYGMDEWKLRVMEATVAHKKDIDFGLLMGEWFNSGTETYDNNVFSGSTMYTAHRASRGFYRFISTNSGSAADTDYTLRSGGTNFFYTARQYLRYGSKRKILMVSDYVAAFYQLKDFLEDTPQVQIEKPRTTKLGFNAQSFLTPFGTVDLVIHPRLSSSDYSGYNFWIDPANVRRRPMRNRDTKYRPIPFTGQDSVEGEILTEVGLQCMQEQTHGFFEITGLTS